MKYLYLLSRQEGETTDWDQYFGAVVCAESEEEAKGIHPDGDRGWSNEEFYNEWTKNPTVKLLGPALGTVPIGVVLASYKAA